MEKTEKFGGIEIPISMGLATKTSIYQLTAEGKIPHAKISGKLIFCRTDLEEWVRKHAVPVKEPSV